MDAFKIRDTLVGDYAEYVRSFITIADERIDRAVEKALSAGALWPEPLIQLNPAFAPGASVDELVAEGILEGECAGIFRAKSEDGSSQRLNLYRHQEEAIRVAAGGANYVLTTGTGSGKSLAYIIPIVDRILKSGSGKGVKAIVVYPMNALANSQLNELEKFLCRGYPAGKPPVTFARYTGQEGKERRQEIIASPPDIILTNYVMLELILTRPADAPLLDAAAGLQFLVLDELHTYRGRQGADVSMLVRRVRDRLADDALQCVGTSATLAGSGTWEEKRAEVARVASTIFGSTVEPESVIGESLRRVTEPADVDAEFTRRLSARLSDSSSGAPLDYGGFVQDPLSVWIETTFGVTLEPGTARLVRAEPRAIVSAASDGTLSGAAVDLAALTGRPVERCAAAIRAHLLAGGTAVGDTDTGTHPFAFRLHQFISRGDTVYASLESPGERYITLQGQQFVPGDRTRVLLPLVFCRECGQEFYAVRAIEDEQGRTGYNVRQLSDSVAGDGSDPGFLFVSDDRAWPSDAEAIVGRLPEDWLEGDGDFPAIKRSARPRVPRQVIIGPDGVQSDDGLECAFIPAPFPFCPRCGISYGARTRSDIGKLTSLGTEARSTATTILSLSAVRSLRAAEELKDEARKLLSFTDNRQDAALQAGHFNDFVGVGVLRAALYKAASEAGPGGLSFENLTQKVFEALALPVPQYASNPEVRFNTKEETDRALRNVLGYRLYQDLKRGWRVTAPNLEQAGLLTIDYASLDEMCAEEDVWDDRSPALLEASSDVRSRVCRILLDFMRRELAIKVEFLNKRDQERLQQQSSAFLRAPWAIDENEVLEHGTILFPRPQHGSEYAGFVFLSAFGGFGQYLRRRSTFPDHRGKVTTEMTQRLIADLLDCLRIGGQVEVVMDADGDDGVPGYQLQAGALRWVAGDGTRAYHDPIRVPNEPEGGHRANPFFVDYYREDALQTRGIEAHEHTAQVPYEEREEREKAFREGRLPVLYCSPTMELGVDIAQLNAVNMRNVPPTPANYAQRSGRAGRSGQPALVFTYCSTGNSHDQYFFKRPTLMVSGSVTSPRLDLANEDLVRAHVQAVWLAETGLSLGTSLADILDLDGEHPSLELQPHVRDAIASPGAREKARRRAEKVLRSLEADLAAVDWYHARWLDDVFAQVAAQFDAACERWRGLYEAALHQQEVQNKVILDATRKRDERKKAQALRREAEAQLSLLRDADNIAQSDFYSYRYFASEGFLPGYNFPRLPLSAFVPARKNAGRDEYVSRPRFLAISEFGPRAFIYHEGSQYVINKVILPVGKEGEDDSLTLGAKLCGRCGYLHQLGERDVDLCENCETPLGLPLTQLFRLQNVATRRRQRISCDEEERQRLGYDLVTAYAFAESEGRPLRKTAEVREGDDVLATLTYGHAATLWRINRGWRRRKKRAQYGFVLDLERGFWAKNEAGVEADPDDPMPKGGKTARVIPFVEDHRNCLILEPGDDLTSAELLSLQSALKNGIQIRYQLEDSELGAELLPSDDIPHSILFYESAEGGAGVLRRLVDDPGALGEAARAALEVCHFDPDTLEDRRRALLAREDCEAACYDCLMTYANQRSHRQLDRKLIVDYLGRLRDGAVQISPGGESRGDHLERLTRQAGSELERGWLRFMADHGFALPTRAQVLIEAAGTTPDFLYDDERVAVYVDGPPHDYPERQDRDRDQEVALEDLGFIVVRFRHDGDWRGTCEAFRSIFGAGAEPVGTVHQVLEPESEVDLDLFDDDWHDLVTALAGIPGIEVEPGTDLAADGRVVGCTAAQVRSGDRVVHVVNAEDPSAGGLVAAIAEEGGACVQLEPNDTEGNLAAIMSALEDGS